ncbi:MAG: hypothetical protein RID07_19840 [Lacipirellulaceae bacterium]
MVVLVCVSLTSLAQLASAQILAVTSNGDINAGTTWDGGVAPTAGDTNLWGTSNFTVRTGTQTWEGQELIVQTGGRLGTNTAGPTLTMNGDLTLDGGTIKNLNNLNFTIDLQGNTLNLNSGTLDSGDLNPDRDLRIQNAVLAGNGTIAVEGGDAAAANRSDFIFENTVDTSAFTGTLTALFRTRLFLPEVPVEDASFGINVGGSGGISLANNLAVMSAQFNNFIVPAGSYSQSDLLGLGVNVNRFIGAGSGILTVVSGLAGDFDLDGDVNGSDFLQWQRDTSIGDLADWQADYGLGLPSAATAITAVPEPTSLLTPSIALCLTLPRRSRWTQQIHRKQLRIAWTYHLG